MGLAIINISYDMYSFRPAESSLAVSTFQYNLTVNGLEDIVYFPSHDKTITIANMKQAFTDFLQSNDCKVYAFSCWSNSFLYIKELVEIARKVRPNSLLVAGGVHFHSKDAISETLQDGLFDIVFAGGGDTFIDFCLSYFVKHTLEVKKSDNGISIKPKPSLRGYNYISNGKLALDGYSKMSYPVLPTIFNSDNGYELQVFFSDKCNNGCDYCSVFKLDTSPNARAVTEQLVLAQIDFIREDYDGEITISLMDSSPFQDACIKQTINSLRKIMRYDDNMSLVVFADPENISNEFIEIIKELKIKTIFLGRDSVTTDKFIGRKLHGKLRSEELLDDEFETFKDFVSKVKLDKLKLDVFLGYIVSPFADSVSAKKMLNEAKYYAMQSDNNLNLQANVFLLNPYRSSRLYKEAKDFIVADVTESFFGYPNVWDSSLDNYNYMEYIRFIVSPILSTGKYPKLGYNLFHYIVEMCFGNVDDDLLQLDINEQLIYEFIISKIEKLSINDKKYLYALGALPPYVLDSEVTQQNMQKTLDNIILNDLMINFV